MSKLLKHVGKKWQGPSIEVSAGGRSYIFGRKEDVKTRVVVKNNDVLKKMVKSPSLSFGEAYMSGDIEIEGDLMDVLKGFHLSPSPTPKLARKMHRWAASLPISVSGGKKNAQHHYDIGNDFYEMWLDESLTYSCAYFETLEDSLGQAQTQKRERICQKLDLQPGQTLLDIGCGWGALLFHAVEKYGVRATGITPAKEQAKHIMEQAKLRGVEDKIEVIVDDWRRLPKKKYDRIVSVGMFEHVGRKQYDKFLKKWQSMLHPQGISLLHTIGAQYPSVTDRWIDKYIFPGGYLPSVDEVAMSANKADLFVRDLENMRPHYAETLNKWDEGVMEHRQEVVNMFDEDFLRMWHLYLKSLEAGFRWGNLQLFQFVLQGREAKWPLARV